MISSIFIKALALLLDLEGVVFTNDPVDRGGATRYGITQEDYNHYCNYKKIPLKSVKYIDKQQVTELYQQFYWQKMKLDLVSEMKPKSSIFLFQYGVLHGDITAIKHLQQVLEIKDDGLIGKNTLKAISEVDDDLLVEKLAERQKQLISDIVEANSSQQRFEKGWYNRVQKTLDFLEIH